MTQSTKDQKLQQKQEIKTEKLLNKKAAKSTAYQDYLIAKKTHGWLIMKHWAFAFIALTILLVVAFVLTKYLNYYFNFGKMNAESAAEVKLQAANWWTPFNQWNWSITDDFENIVTNINLPGENSGNETFNIVVVKDVFWNGTTLAVTRQAFTANQFANGILFFGVPTAGALAVLLLIGHFVFAPIRVKKIMGSYISLRNSQAIQNHDLAGASKGTGSNGAGGGSNVHASSLVVNFAGTAADADKTLIQAQQLQPEYIVNTVEEEVTQPVVVEKTVKEKPVQQKIIKTTHVHKIEPEVEIEEHFWEKPDALPKIKKIRKTYPSLGKNDIIDEIYNDLKGTLTLRELNNIYDVTFDSIIEELESNTDQEISIFNFGKFTTVTKEARNGINPATGEKIWIEEKSKIKFAPSSNFKKLMEDANIKEKTIKTTKTVVSKVVKKG